MIVIDDEVGICDVLKKLFTHEGYEVWAETDPIKGLDLVRDKAPDVVLLDIKMPGMDGLDVLKRIKERDEKIAVIMITGHGALDSAMESLKLGAYDYISKPFDLAFITDLVKKCRSGRA
jgi:two-component system response regulator (stage 0 sporulation protein F)